jgi:CRISPR/Cas system-associated exonuclease Cas4 (RecB family)
LARTLYSGVLVSEKDPIKALEQTKELFKKNSILFEPAFLCEDLYFRADILESNKSGMSITEYKSSTEIKEYHRQDLAIQAYILQKLGHKIDKLLIAYVNKKYTRDLPLKDLFIKEDLTEETMDLLPWVEEQIINIKKIALAGKEPKIDIGPHCNKPHECPYKKYCYKQKNIPEVSVLDFPHLNHKWELYKQGKIKISDLRDSDLNTDKQKQTLMKLQQKKPYINKKVITEILSNWKYPIYFLDFETLSFGYPIFDKLRPFQEIPFQFSCYSLKGDTAELVNECSYIVDSLDKDPRFDLAKILIKALGKKGPIVAYNAPFEKKVIEGLAELIPSLKNDLLNLTTRLVDLYPIMKDYVYYPEFKLSWSIKSVTPALFGKSSSYDELNISNGLESQQSYLNAIKNGNLEHIKSDLIAYCNKDVLEMVRIFHFLKELK